MTPQDPLRGMLGEPFARLVDNITQIVNTSLMPEQGKEGPVRTNPTTKPLTQPMTVETWIARFRALHGPDKEFVLRVLLAQGGKGSAEPYYDSDTEEAQALWKNPEDAGLIVAEGSYKFISTVDATEVLWHLLCRVPQSADPLDIATQAVQQPTLVTALTLAARHAAPEALEQAIRMTIAMWIEAGGLEEWDQAALCAARAARAAAPVKGTTPEEAQAMHQAAVEYVDHYRS
jgi:hypothetical protein